MLTPGAFRRKYPQGKYSRYRHNVQASHRRRTRETRALGSWSPVARGPLPPVIEAMFRRRAEGETQRWAAPRQRAIREGTNALAQQLAPVAGRVGGYYQQAQAGQAASDAALAQILSGQGQGLSESLAAQLAAAGQSAAPAQAQLGVGQGAAGASYATGSSGLAQLLSQGAAAQGYAAQLPAVARFGGAQANRQLQGQALSMSQDLYRNMLDRELEKWIARTGLGTEQAGLGLQRQQLRENRRQFDVGLAAERAEAAKPTKAEMKAATKARWKDVPKAVDQVETLARQMNATNVPWAQAMNRLRQALRRRIPWMSQARVNSLARRIAVANGINRPGSPGAGGPVGEGPDPHPFPEDPGGGGGL